MPKPLEQGDLIALLAPASAVARERVAGAERALVGRGYRVRVYPSAVGEPWGSFSASEEQRIAELTEALTDAETAAVLCARGGYGCVHLLPALSRLGRIDKWIIGFSDVSALHAWSNTNGVAGMHASMAKHLAEFPADDPQTEALFRYLTSPRGTVITDTFPVSPLNRPGEATGKLVGGNLAVVNALAATPWDVLNPSEPSILLLEDVSEKIYAVERMLTRLYLTGALSRGNVRGIIFGQFTDYHPDRNHTTMEEMISARLARWDLPPIPIVFDAPYGHIDSNRPVALGVPTRLVATPAEVRIEQTLI